MVISGTDELSGVVGWSVQALVGDAVPVQPTSADNFTAFLSPGNSVSENHSLSLSQLIGDNQTDNLTIYGWFLDRAGNISSSLEAVASAKNHDNSTGGMNDNVSVSRPSTDFLWITFHHQDRSNSII